MECTYFQHCQIWWRVFHSWVPRLHNRLQQSTPMLDHCRNLAWVPCPSLLNQKILDWKLERRDAMWGWGYFWKGEFSVMRGMLGEVGFFWAVGCTLALTSQRFLKMLTCCGGGGAPPTCSSKFPRVMLAMWLFFTDVRSRTYRGD